MKPSKKSAVTLENIGQLIDQKLAPVVNDLDLLKSRVEEVNVDLGARINNVGVGVKFLDANLKVFKEETQGNFDVVFDGLTLLGTSIDKDIDPRLKRTEQKLFA